MIWGLLPGPQADCATERDPRGRHKSPPAGPGHPVSSAAARRVGEPTPAAGMNQPHAERHPRSRQQTGRSTAIRIGGHSPASPRWALRTCPARPATALTGRSPLLAPSSIPRPPLPAEAGPWRLGLVPQGRPGSCQCIPGPYRPTGLRCAGGQHRARQDQRERDHHGRRGRRPRRQAALPRPGAGPGWPTEWRTAARGLRPAGPRGPR